MQYMLNFSKEEKNEILKFLQTFPKEETKTSFEEFRCKIGKSTVTLYTSGKLLLQGDDCEKARDLVLENVEVENELVLGIDETGRGEDFGPFVIVAVLARPNAMRELRDSKKVKNLDEKAKLVEKNAEGIGVFSVSSEELVEFREKGMNLNAIEAKAINELCDFFKNTGKVKIIVDGSPLKGCKERIEFLVKGDDLNPVVGAASIVAKSVRDASEDRGKRKGWGTWSKKN